MSEAAKKVTVTMLRARLVGNVNREVGDAFDVEESVAEYLVKEGDATADYSSRLQPVKGDPEPVEPVEPTEGEAVEPEPEPDKPATGRKRLGA